MCELMKSISNALGQTLCLMQYLEHPKFLEYLLGVSFAWGLRMKGVGMHVAEDHFDVI